MLTTESTTTIDALHLAYCVLLGMPHDEYRAKHQLTLAAVRNAIAEMTGKEPEAVQNEYEAIASYFQPTGRQIYDATR